MKLAVPGACQIRLRTEPGAMLLNGFNRTPFAGRLIACCHDDLLHPIKDVAERAAQAKFLTALPRHEPGWLLLTEGKVSDRDRECGFRCSEMRAVMLQP